MLLLWSPILLLCPLALGLPNLALSICCDHQLHIAGGWQSRKDSSEKTILFYATTSRGHFLLAFIDPCLTLLFVHGLPIAMHPCLWVPAFAQPDLLVYSGFATAFAKSFGSVTHVKGTLSSNSAGIRSDQLFVLISPCHSFCIRGSCWQERQQLG